MNVFERIQLFFNEVYVELRKVNWLSYQQIIRYTLLVLGVTIIVAAFLGGLDYLFSTVIQKFVIK